MRAPFAAPIRFLEIFLSFALFAAPLHAGEAEPPAAEAPAAPASPEDGSPAPPTSAPEPAQPLTLEDAVRLALAANLTLTAEQYNRLTARENVIVAESEFDPVLGLTARRNYSQRVASANELDQSNSDGFTTTASIAQRIDTGATATLSSDLSRQQNNRPGNLLNPAFDSQVALTVRQPLLQGGGLTVNRIPRMRARIGVERSDLAFRAQALDVVRDTELAYYDLAFAQLQLEVQRSGLAAAEQFLRENEARRAAGLATELDIMQARVGVANRRSSIISAEQRVRDARDRLLALLGRMDFTGNIMPAGVQFSPPETISVSKAYGIAVQNDPDILSAQAQIRQLELDVRLAENQRLPRLDLGGTLGYTGLNDTLKGSGDRLLDRNSYNWQIDLTVSVPWGLREGRSRLRTSRLTLNQQKVRLRQLEQNLLVRIRAAVRAVESDTQLIDTSALSTELSTREFQLEKAKYDAGSSTSRLVVEAQQRRDEAQVAETQARVQTQQDLAELRRVQGLSLDHYGLDALEPAKVPETIPPAPQPEPGESASSSPANQEMSGGR